MEYFLHPMTANAERIIQERYARYLPERKCKENWQEICRRIADVISRSSVRFKDFPDGDAVSRMADVYYRYLEQRLVIPNTPTFSGAGTPIGQLAACFVLSISDSLVEAENSIYSTMRDAAAIQQTGGGVGFNFSNIRPKGALVVSSGGKASGPVSFLQAYNNASATVQQGGTRRGANMAILDVSHPDIEEFISCKQKEGDLSYFNISVGISEKFMNTVDREEPWPLIDPRDGHTVRRVDSKSLFRQICQNAWKNGEPGIVFLDRMDADNPNRNMYRITTTNPCITGDSLVYTSCGLWRMSDVIKSKPGEIKLCVGSEFVGDTAQKIGTYPLLQGVSNFVKREEKREVLEVRTVAGFKIRVTPEHLFWAKERMDSKPTWMAAKDLKQGHIVHMLDDVSMRTRYRFERAGLLDTQDFLFGCLLAILCEADQNPETLLARTRTSEWRGWDYTPGMKSHVGWILKQLFVSISSDSLMQQDYLSSLVAWGIDQRDNAIRYEKVFRSADQVRWGFACASLSLYGEYDGIKDSYRVDALLVEDEYLDVLQQVLLHMGVFSTRNGKKGVLYLPIDQMYKIKCLYFYNFVNNLVMRKESHKILEERLARYERNLRTEADGSECPTQYEAVVSSVKACERREIVYDLTSESSSFVANGFQIHNCGEQPLGDGESCCLGHLNLPAHFNMRKNELDWEKLRESVQVLTQMLDGTISANKFVPTVPKLARMAAMTRKIGVGITGFADVLALMGLQYGTPESFVFANKLMEFIRYHAMSTSVSLSQAMGPFLNYGQSMWAPQRVKSTSFYKLAMEKGTLDWDALFCRMESHGIRNSCVLTIAPTGTTSTVLGTEGYGCEPIFALTYSRKLADGTTMKFCSRIAEVIIKAAVDASEMTEQQGEMAKEFIKQSRECEIENPPPRLAKLIASVCERVAPLDHIRMQDALQTWVDSSISKTINCSNQTAVWDVEEMLRFAYTSTKIKGMTVYRNNSRSEQVLEVKPEMKQRDTVSEANVYQCKAPFGKVFLTLSRSSDGEPFETFINCGKAGSDVMAHTEAIGRLISFALRLNSPMKPTDRLREIREQLSGIGGGKTVRDPGQRSVSSLPDAIAYCIGLHLGMERGQISAPSTVKSGDMEICPECQCATLLRVEGCRKCMNCSYSACS